MVPWIDHKLFGIGHGLKTPLHDGVFYFLSGRFYTFSHGFGAQLCNIQWRTPKPGERRNLAGYEFVVFNTQRRWFRVLVSWGVARLPENLDEAHSLLRKIKSELSQI